jgi:aryl-alcohol dehydrogenase-like predicted oxidoreductase
MWIGEWMKKRNNRDEMVIATKFTTPFRAGKGNDEIIINTAGEFEFLVLYFFFCSILVLGQKYRCQTTVQLFLKK